MTITDKPKGEQFDIIVPVTRKPERTMILRQGIGNGEVDGDKFDISTTVGDSSPVWYFSKEGRYYTISIRKLTELVVEGREKLLTKAGLSVGNTEDEAPSPFGVGELPNPLEGMDKSHLIDPTKT